MNLSVCVVVALIVPLCVCQSSECKHKNVSCNDIRVKDSRGFKFVYECSPAIDVSVYYNQTVIAHARPSEPEYNFSTGVISMSNSSIVTTECRDLKIQCVLNDGQYVDETCEEFKVNEEEVNPNVTPPLNLLNPDVTPPLNLLFGLLLLIPIIGGVFCYWKRKQHGVTVSVFLKFLRPCCCHRQFSDPSRHCDQGQDSTTYDVETPHSDFSLVDISPHDPHGGDGNQQDNTTGTAPAHTNLNDDPGGASTMRTMNLNSGCAHGDRGPEGQPLLLGQRAAVHTSDMPAEAEALVNKHDFGPDQVDRCSTAQDKTWSQTQDEEGQ